MIRRQARPTRDRRTGTKDPDTSRARIARTKRQQSGPVSACRLYLRVQNCGDSRCVFSFLIFCHPSAAARCWSPAMNSRRARRSPQAPVRGARHFAAPTGREGAVSEALGPENNIYKKRKDLPASRQTATSSFARDARSQLLLFARRMRNAQPRRAGDASRATSLRNRKFAKARKKARSPSRHYSMGWFVAHASSLVFVCELRTKEA